MEYQRSRRRARSEPRRCPTEQVCAPELGTFSIRLTKPRTKPVHATDGLALITRPRTSPGPISAMAEEIAIGPLYLRERSHTAEGASRNGSKSTLPSTARGVQSASGTSPHRATVSIASAHAARNSHQIRFTAGKSASMFKP